MNEFQQFMMEEAIEYNIKKGKPLTECIYRRESDAFVEYFKYLKENQDKYTLTDFDKELLSTDIGEKAMYEGEEVWLDLPFIELQEEEKVELNKPKRGGPKKFYVYVKNDKGNVVKVTFGDTTGLSVKFDDEAARKSFVARHDCANKKDKTSPGYWSCNLPKYASQLGLSNGGSFYW
jgi:hypothetical protein